MEKIFIGIDPGFSGGIAIYSPENDSIRAINMPKTPRDIYDFLKGVKEYAERGSCSLHCMMEDVGHGMPGQSSSATAKFARHNGHLEMALLALCIPTETITPQKWQKAFQLGKSSDYTKTQWKNRLKAKAQQLFSYASSKITLSTCDAMLLAEYARRRG